MIEKKGLKVSMGKTKVMVSGEGVERMIIRTDPCGVCDKSESKLGVVYRMSEVGA